MIYSFKSIVNEDRKSYPAKVIENHLSAVNSYMDSDRDFYNLTKLDYFNNGLRKASEYDENKIRRLLHNAWSTEFALNFSGQDVDPDYKKFALHWCFPQTYYSVFLLTTAYFEIKNIPVGHNHKGFLTEFSQQIIRNWYPNAISFYCSGPYNNFTYHNIVAYSPKNPLAFNKNESTNYEPQISQLITTTRNQICEKRKMERQKNNQAFKTVKGKVKDSLNQNDWNMLCRSISNTTIMDFLYRLRIKANYEDINGFIESDYDVSNIIDYLCEIVSKLNFIHEAYIAKLIGIDKFGAIYDAFPLKKDDHHLSERINERIKPLFL